MMQRVAFLSAAVAVASCNDAKTVDPQTPSATPTPRAEAPAVKDEPMPPETREPQTHALGIADGDFFGGSTSKAMAAARKQLRKSKETALQIDAPFAIDTAAHQTFPILGVFGRETPSEDDLEHRAIVVALDLDGGGFHADLALRSPKLAGGGGAEAAGSEPAFVASSFDFDVFERLPKLPRTGATHRVYVLEGGVLSNGVSVELSGSTSADAPQKPETLKSDATKHAASPTAPATRGVVLAVPTRAVSEPGASLNLRGAVRADGDAAQVFLVATSDASTGPFSFAVDVPLEAGVGYFNVDVLVDVDSAKRPAQWHWYAFVGLHSAGPASVLLDPGKPW